MPSYEFTIHLTGTYDPDAGPELGGRIFDAGAADATVSGSCGAAQVDFDREASSLEAAINLALVQLKAAGAMPARIELEAAPVPEPV